MLLHYDVNTCLGTYNLLIQLEIFSLDILVP